MNKREKRMLFLARAAINIPFVNNRADTRGLFEYENDMREVIPAFNAFCDALIDIYEDGADDPLEKLAALSEIHVKINTRLQLSPNVDVGEFLKSRQST